MNARILAPTLLALSLLAGCATPVSVSGMTVTPDKAATPPAELARTLDVGDVSGGSKPGMYSTALIENDTFKKALAESLRGAGLLGDAHARYRVTAKILDVDSPFALFVLNARVSSRIRYTVTDTSTGKVVFDQEIEATHVARFGDSFVGSERVRLANQRSARKSIATLIEKLESAGLSGQKAVAIR